MDRLQFHVWGVRGSFPAARREYLEYGGNTVCFSMRCGDALVVLDAGSGLADWGEEILREAKDAADIHILLSHGHIDHLMGLYPFLSMAGAGSRLHLYGGRGIGRCLDTLIGRPYWPCGIAESGASICETEAGADFRLAVEGGRVRVTAMAGSHPGGGLWYRLEYGGRSVVYMLDCEVDESRLQEMLQFAENVDLLVWDACYAPGHEKTGWGHSTWEQGAAFARKARVKKILMAHYARDYDDSFLQKMENEASAALKDTAAAEKTGTAARGGNAAQPECIFARERMVIVI